MARTSRHAVNVLQVKCDTCGAEPMKSCRDLASAPLVIKKSADKRRKEVVGGMGHRAPHDSRIRKAYTGKP